MKYLNRQVWSNLRTVQLKYSSGIQQFAIGFWERSMCFGEVAGKIGIRGESGVGLRRMRQCWIMWYPLGIGVIKKYWKLENDKNTIYFISILLSFYFMLFPGNFDFIIILYSVWCSKTTYLLHFGVVVFILNLTETSRSPFFLFFVCFVHA